MAPPDSAKLKLSDGEHASLVYHNIFEFPLTSDELIKWRAGERAGIKNNEARIKNKRGFYFLAGKEGFVYKRLARKRISAKKLVIAKKAAKTLTLVPTIKLIAITGALAMENAGEEADIDLMIITQKGTLWSTRLLSYLVIWLLGIKTRRPKDNDQKDKLCFNIWLDETSLAWPVRDRNIYTAHEIAQIVSLINKANTYESFLSKNRWVLDYWPNSVKVTKLQSYKVTKSDLFHSVTLFLCYLITFSVEKLVFRMQYFYMKRKITKEVVTPTRALFHPNNWGKTVLSRL